MNIKEREKYKHIIIDVFKAFTEICEENSLRYFCCGGTAIGVIRHQGMIPWDDDIDILMPRPDYEKFVNIFPTLASSDVYEVVTPENDNTYYLPFSKMCNKNTTLLEYGDIPCILGAYIDIFPLDGAPEKGNQRVDSLQKFRRAANKMLVVPKLPQDNLRVGVKRLLKFQLRTALNEFTYSVNKTNARIKILNEIDSEMKAVDFNQAVYVGNYGGMWGIKEFAPKKWFEDFETGQFEGLTVRIPKGYHNLLTQMYGDYMQSPPEEKRQSHHHFAYLNLDERKNMAQVLKEINK